MKHRFLSGLVFSLVLSLTPAWSQHAESQERAAAAQLLAFGRPAPSVGPDVQRTLAELLAGHRSAIRGDAATKRNVIMLAARDTLGRAPSEAEIDAWARGDATTYTEYVQAVTAWLADQPEENRRVIDRAYRLVINREAYAEEYAYWQPYGTLPYVVLVGAIENWAERNQPGLMVTNGTPSISSNSRFLRTERLSLAVANEARTLLGLPVWTDVARQHSPGRNIVAVGAKDIASVGGVHFLLTGGGPLAGY
jgi:hypothetical protein